MQLHADELTSLASSADAATASAMQTISSEIVRGGAGIKDAMVVSRAELHHGHQELPSLREQIGQQLAGCVVREVVGTVAQGAADSALSEGAITRQQYQVRRCTAAEGGGSPCCLNPAAAATFAARAHRIFAIRCRIFFERRILHRQRPAPAHLNARRSSSRSRRLHWRMS